MKSFISIFLVIVMLLSFVACSGGTEDKKNPNVSKDTTSSNEPNKSDIVYEEDDLPDDLNFGGQVVNFLAQNSADKNTEICTEELNSDIVNDSVYNRERFIEDRLNIELEPILVTFGDINIELERQMASDEDMYQICAHATSDFSKSVFKAYFYDLYELNYLNFDKPWWSQTFNDESEILDSLYFTTGSLALSLLRYTFAIFYNKTLAENNAEDIPELLDLYNMVESGDWTFDKLNQLSSTIFIDNNGNDTPDEEDTYGIGMQRAIGVDTMWSSFDIDVLAPDGEGWFELVVSTEKLYSAMEMVNNLLYNNTGCYNSGTSDEDLDTLAAMFASDNLLFMNNSLDAIETATLRNMQSDYGILPFPKYDSKQDNYYSYSHDWYTTFAIPNTNRNPDVAAAVLEAMASYSYRDTVPAYLDTALKGKYMSDPQSRRMIDLVVEGFKVDASWIYLKTIGADFPTTFRRMLSDNKTNYSSEYATASRNVKMRLKAQKIDFEAKLG
ncbi:MAG: hypothetical protein IKT70_07070 [Clostridia bacterium]|nr:hypothetical protein [Clostridia bacterium]